MTESKEEGKKITIVTHSSGFHTDDVFAVATLLILLDGESVEVIRSREKDIIDVADYVVDTGNTHEPEKNRFDHHQEGKAGERPNGIPYASFGLVWKKFGEKLTGSIKVSEAIDKILIQPIDAGDNGVTFLETKIPGVRPFDIGMLTHIFSPTWKEDENVDEVFMRVVSYAKILILRLTVSVRDAVEAEQLVIDNYNSSSDKRLIIIDERYPWNDTLSKFKEPLFAVYKNQQGNWSINGIRDDSFSFVYRKYLPLSWAGKRDEELARITGVQDAVFCHNHRFMGVAKTKEGVLKMAEIALNS